MRVALEIMHFSFGKVNEGAVEVQKYASCIKIVQFNFRITIKIKKNQAHLA